jgi:hypothetical protein
LNFANARQRTESTFATLNPQYPASLGLNTARNREARARADAAEAYAGLDRATANTIQARGIKLTP